MKVDELRVLPNEEIESRLDEAREELFNLRFQNATGQLENYKRLGIVRRDIARLTTVLRERDLGIERALLDERPKRTKKFRARRVEEEAPEEEEVNETENNDE